MQIPKPRLRLLAATALGVVGLAGAGLGLGGALVPDKACFADNEWGVPGARPAPTSAATQASAAARQQVVLLGETHADAAHHRWQLDALKALHRVRPDMVVGFEMFPRRVQPVLDRWVRGELDEEAFLRETDWDRNWRFESNLYLPLFRFARDQRIPMLALNVDGALSREAGRIGWQAIPPERREGVGDPAPASEEYRMLLKEIHGQHAPRPSSGGKAASEADQAFERFVSAQLLWDRAMAEPLARAARGDKPPLVVGVMGNGHVEFGYGVPHQLRALGVQRFATWVPVPVATPCRDLTAGLADAVVALKPDLTAKPRLGVMMEAAKEGVAIREVVADSVAERAGLKSGDVVITAAGERVATPDDLIRAVRRHGPGTRLVLAVRRQSLDREVVAVFPREGD